MNADRLDGGLVALETGRLQRVLVHQAQFNLRLSVFICGS
jgi:hypothetical protein